MKIATVLCPIDFSPLFEYELRLAAEVCQAFGARLTLQHSLGGIGAETAAEESAAQERLQEAAAGVSAAVRTETRISYGPVGTSILGLAIELPADLLILGSHGWSSREHVSISEEILGRAPCPILAFQEGKGEHTFSLRAGGEGAARALVPSDFSKAAGAAVEYAFELARATPLEIHLLSVCASDQEVDVTRQRLAGQVPADLEGRVQCHARIGSVGDGIAELARSLDAELLVMGEHAPDFLRRYLTHDTAREMLHRAQCPVWYVPRATLRGDRRRKPAAGGLLARLP